MCVSAHRPRFLHDRLHAETGKLLWIGVALVVVGIAAIAFPILSTVVATSVLGALLLIAGCLMIASAFTIQGAGPFFGALLISLLSIGAGVFLLANPSAGAIALTLVLGIIFLVQSAFEIVFSLEIRPFPGWVGMLISGLLSLLMAILIIATWPGISLIALGIIFGVNFISTGVAYVIVSRSLRPLD